MNGEEEEEEEQVGEAKAELAVGRGEKEIQNYDQIAPGSFFVLNFSITFYLCGQETVTCEGPPHLPTVGSILSLKDFVEYPVMPLTSNDFCCRSRGYIGDYKVAPNSWSRM